jgi:hypothetical protein
MATPTLTSLDLRRLADAVAEAGLTDPDLDEVLAETSSRIDRLRAEFGALLNGADAARRDLVDRVTTGAITAAEAATAEADIPVAGPTADRVRRLQRRATDHAHTLAQRRLKAAGPGLFQRLVEVDRKLLAEAEKLAPQVDGIAGDAEALTAPTKAREAYGALHDIAIRRGALAGIVVRLRSAGAVPPLTVDSTYATVGRPQNRPLGYGGLSAVRKLVADLDCGADLGIFTAAEAAEHAAAELAEHRAAERGTPVSSTPNPAA